MSETDPVDPPAPASSQADATATATTGPPPHGAPTPDLETASHPDAPMFPQGTKTSARKSGGGRGWMLWAAAIVLVGGAITLGVLYGPAMPTSRLAVRDIQPSAALSPAVSPSPAMPLTPAPAPAVTLEATPVQPVGPLQNSVGQLTSDIERLMAQRYAAQAGEQARAVETAEAAAAAREADLQRRIQASEAQLAVTRSRSAVAAGELSALVDAAFSDRPFVAEAAALVRRLPDDVDARALLALSAYGAPSRAALASDFEAVATAAAVAQRGPGPNADWLDRLGHALLGPVMLRRTDADAPGDDGVLARAALHVRGGDLAGAAAELRDASPAVQTSTAGWRSAVARRLEIDRRLPAVRDAALLAVEAAPAAPPVSPQAALVAPVPPTPSPTPDPATPAPSPAAPT